jgi:hypothetical protein
MTFNLLPLFVAAFVGLAALSYIFRAWPRVVGLTGAALAIGMALWLWSLDFGQPYWVFPNGTTLELTAPITRFGYTFRLQAANAPIVAMNLAIAAAALLLAARTTADRTFAALAWLLLAGYNLLALVVAGPIAPALASPILLVMLSALSVFALQGNRSVNPTGAVRMLIPPILAVPVFFLAAWYVDQLPLNPQDMTLPQITGGLLGLGLLLLMTPFPLHTGGPATASTAPAPATLLVFLLGQLAVLHLAGQLLAAYPIILTEADWGVLLALFGLMTAVWGGVAAIGATTAGQLWGYAALHDWGLIIVVLATPGVQSWTLVLFLFRSARGQHVHRCGRAGDPRTAPGAAGFCQPARGGQPHALEQRGVPAGRAGAARLPVERGVCRPLVGIAADGRARLAPGGRGAARLGGGGLRLRAHRPHHVRPAGEPGAARTRRQHHRGDHRAGRHDYDWRCAATAQQLCRAGVGGVWVRNDRWCKAPASAGSTR